MVESPVIPIESNPLCIPQEKTITERGFGTIIGITRSLHIGAAHLPEKLWAEAIKAAV